MSLNIGEANAVHRVVRWLTTLDLFERTGDPDALPGEEDRDLLGAVVLLAAAARRTLGAGPAADEVERNLRAVLGVDPSPMQRRAP